MKKLVKKILPKILILTLIINGFFLLKIPKSACAVTTNTISINSDPFGGSYRTSPYDVDTSDFGKITFKGTDDGLTTRFEYLSWMKGQGMAYGEYYTGNQDYKGLTLSADSSDASTGIWMVFGTKDRSKKFSFKSFDIGEFYCMFNKMEVIGFNDGVQVASQSVTFNSGTPTNQRISMSSEFGNVDEIRMRQRTEGQFDSGFPGFEGIVVNNFELSDAVVPKVEFSNASCNVSEGVGNAVLSISRTGDITKAVTVDYSTIDGTAKKSIDYTETSGTLTFGVNETSKTITIPIIDNTTYNGDRTFQVVLSNPFGGAVIGVNGTNTVTIKDNEYLLSYTAGSNGSITGTTISNSVIWFKWNRSNSSA